MGQDPFAYLLNAMSAETLRIFIVKDLSLWHFVRQEKSCAGLLLLFRMFRKKIDLWLVTEASVTQYVRENRPDLLAEIEAEAGKAWLRRQIREVCAELNNL